MPMYDLIDYIAMIIQEIYGNTIEMNQQPAGALDRFTDNSASFKYKQKITVSAEDDGTKTFKIMVPLKYLSNFWRTLPLVNCEINLVLIWSTNYCCK